jgi:phosphoesterase RecJ-like protein
VDHHLSNPLYADLNLVDSNATCTGQVVKALMDKINLSSGSDGSNNSQTSAPATDLSLPASAAKVETDKEILTIDQDLASLLYITLLTDTGGFRHSNTTPEVFKWAAELCDQGANPSYLYQQLYSQMPYKTLKIISAALNSMELTEVAGLKIVTTVTTKADLEKYEASDEDTDEIVDHLMRIKDVDMCIYLRQDSADHENGSYKGSLRSACHIDCSEIASELNGGGHARAAGFNLTAKSFDEIFELVLNKIKDKQATTA